MIKNEGYVVVRLPKFLNYHPINELNFFSNEETLSTYYCGLDRQPWFDLDELFYENDLSEELKKIRTKIISSKLGTFSPGVCENEYIAQEILEHSGDKNEVIKISLFQDKKSNSEILGYDCYVDGFGSPIILGIFQKKNAFTEFLPLLNVYGLFESHADLQKYVIAYSERCLRENLEIIDINYQTIDVFEVSR